MSKTTLRSDNHEISKEELRRQHQEELARQKNEETLGDLLVVEARRETPVRLQLQQNSWPTRTEMTFLLRKG